MTRTEKLVTAAVLSVNLTVGAVLAARADYSTLLGTGSGTGAEAEDPVAALSPVPEAHLEAKP